MGAALKPTRPCPCLAIQAFMACSLPLSFYGGKRTILIPNLNAHPL